MRPRARAGAFGAPSRASPALEPTSGTALDARIQRLARAHEDAQGPSPSAWAWLSLGGEGRGEPAPGADQDHALVLADPDAPGQEAWARGLAERVEAALAADGVPRCPGGFTAGRWRLGLDELCRRARGWLAEPTPEAALAAGAFLDARPVAGALDASPLRAVLLRAPDHPGFLQALARAALAFRPPGQVRLVRLALRGALDLKREALAPLVLAARALGAAAGCAGTGTLARLAAARDAGLVGAGLARDAAAAFELLSALRRRAAGPALAVRALPAAERAALRRALAAARSLQEAAARRLGVE